jgi:hypothetical protein
MIDQEHVMTISKPPIKKVHEINSCKRCPSLHHPLGILPNNHHSLTLKHNPKVLIFTCYVSGPSTLNTCEGFYTLEVLVFNNVVATNVSLTHKAPARITSSPCLVPMVFVA